MRKPISAISLLLDKHRPCAGHIGISGTITAALCATTSPRGSERPRFRHMTKAGQTKGAAVIMVLPLLTGAGQRGGAIRGSIVQVGIDLRELSCAAQVYLPQPDISPASG